MRTKLAALSIACALLAAAGLTFPAASTAALSPTASLSAVPVPSTSPEVVEAAWVAAPCATGAFGAAYSEQGHLLVPATITICDRWKAKFTFTIAAFYPSQSIAFAFGTRLRPYVEIGPTAVTADLYSAPAAGSPVGSA